MPDPRTSPRPRVAVIWIDWYAYHVARFRGLNAAPALAGKVAGIELVGGVGVHKGLKFREPLPADLTIQTLMPDASWREADKGRLSRMLWQKLNELDPEVVLVPGYYTLPAIVAALWARLHRRASVLMTESCAFDHSRSWWKEKLKSLGMRLLFNWAVSGGKAHVSYLHELGFPQDRIVGFYDVVDNDMFSRGAYAERLRSAAEAGLPAEPYFLYVGRLAEEKNAMTLLKSWIAFRKEGGTWPLMLVGDGPERPALEAAAAATPFGRDVYFPGLRSSRELLPYYAHAGCFVLPSTREPWGLVVNEAMAAGLPVLVSERCGLRARSGLSRPERLDARSERRRADHPKAPRHRPSSRRPARRHGPLFGGAGAFLLAAEVRLQHSVDRGCQPTRAKPGGSRRRVAVNALTQGRKAAKPPAGSPSRWVEVVSHTDPKYGGLSAAVPALGERIAAASGREITLAAFCAPDEHFRPLGYEGDRIGFWPVGRKPWLLDRSLRARFSETIRGAAGVHIHGLWEQSTAVAAGTARTCGVPYLISAHGMLEPWALANKRLKKLVYAALIERTNVERAACLHALTLAEAQHFIRFGAQSPIAVIPNGVDIPAERDPGAFFQRYPALAAKRIVLFLARLHPKKGLDLLAESWAALASDWPDAHLVIAGPDSEGTQARTERLLEHHNLAHTVTFAGMLSGAIKWSALAAAEAFVLPSFSEGLSVGVLEAMGMGLPVIVTTPCNMPVVLEQRAGWEMEPAVAPLTRALGEMLSNTPSENRAIGRRGARLVATHYNWPTVARRMEDLYRWVEGGATPSNIPQNVEFLYP